MGLRHRSSFPSGAFFVTTSTRDRGIYFGTDSDYEMVEENIEFYRSREEALIFGYVIMPNHFHLIISFPEHSSISNFMRDFKRMTAREFYRMRNMKTGNLWQERFDDVRLETKEVGLIKLNYIHLNPVRAGLVENVGDWKYSSARFYLHGEKGKITITGMEP